MQRALESYLRERGDVTGTFQLQSMMKLLFDERAGESTLAGLRRDVYGTSVRDARGRGGNYLRMVAAVAGAALGGVALWATQGGSPAGDPPPPLVEATVAPITPGSAVGPGVIPETPPTPAPTPTSVVSASPGALAVGRAEAALRAGTAVVALKAFEEAFELDPTLRVTHARSYAGALADDGRRILEEGGSGAVERFRAAIAAAPDLFEPHFMLGNVFTREGRVEEAMAEYRKALAINPDSADAHFNLGFLHVRQENFQEAVAEYERASKLAPSYPEDVFYNLSVCYERLGRRSAALEAVERGLVKVPDSETLAARKQQLTE